MSWLLSLLVGWLPDLWILPALAAGGLWVYGWICPARIAAEVVRLGSIGLACLAVYLWVYADATAACEARTAAAVAAETARQETINADAIAEARAAATAASTDHTAAEAKLAAALAELRSSPPAPAGSCRSGLSARALRALPE